MKNLESVKPRTKTAIYAIMKALRYNQIAAGSCAACFAGTVIRESNNFDAVMYGRMPYWKTRGAESKPINPGDWFHVIDSYRSKVDLPEAGLAQIEKTGFSISELDDIEHFFETKFLFHEMQNRNRAHLVKTAVEDTIFFILTEIDNMPSDLASNIVEDLPIWNR